MWKRVVDAKYGTKKPNILCCADPHPSTFWKGVMWATQAVKIGYRWKVGNGKLVKFWEDIWFGSSPLSTQFWEVYSVVHQQTLTVAEVWDGSQLRCDFRRTFTDDMMVQWLEVVDIARSLVLSEEEDQLIWQYEMNGVYSSKSMYALVKFRGVQPVYLPVIWDIKVPPIIYIFYGLSLRTRS